MLHRAAAPLIDRLDAVSPADGNEERLIQRERCWVEAIRHLTEKGMHTPAGEEEARKILAASGDWVDSLKAKEERLAMPAVLVPGTRPTQ